MSAIELYKACAIPHIDHTCPAEGRSCVALVLEEESFEKIAERLFALVAEHVSLSDREQAWVEMLLKAEDGDSDESDSDSERDTEED